MGVFLVKDFQIFALKWIWKTRCGFIFYLCSYSDFLHRKNNRQWFPKVWTPGMLLNYCVLKVCGHTFVKTNENGIVVTFRIESPFKILKQLGKVQYIVIRLQWHVGDDVHDGTSTSALSVYGINNTAGPWITIFLWKQYKYNWTTQTRTCLSS